jgi:hypothetical protein
MSEYFEFMKRRRGYFYGAAIATISIGLVFSFFGLPVWANAIAGCLFGIGFTNSALAKDLEEGVGPYA